MRALTDRDIARESDAALYNAMLDYEAGRLEQAMRKLQKAMHGKDGLVKKYRRLLSTILN